MQYLKGVNLLPAVKETQVKQYSKFNKRIIKYALWLLMIIIINILSYVPVSLEKIQLVNIENQKKQVLAQIKQNQSAYIKYHNLVFRLNILEDIKRSRFYLSRLVKAVDDVTYPSVATQYSIHKDGKITIGLKTDSFTKASISWHKLLMQKKLFTNLNLSSFSNQKGTIPFILKGQINMKLIQEDE